MSGVDALELAGGEVDDVPVLEEEADVEFGCADADVGEEYVAWLDLFFDSAEDFHVGCFGVDEWEDPEAGVVDFDDFDGVDDGEDFAEWFDAVDVPAVFEEHVVVAGEGDPLLVEVFGPFEEVVGCAQDVYA